MKFMLFVLGIVVSTSVSARIERPICEEVSVESNADLAKGFGMSKPDSVIQKCRVGGLTVWYSRESTKKVVETNSKLVVINGSDIHVSDTATNVVSIGDKDGDGVFNAISYSCIEGTCGSVTDYNIDGQLDFRSLNKDSSEAVHMNVGGTWYEKTSSYPNLKVKVGSMEVAVKPSSQGFVFQK